MRTLLPAPSVLLLALILLVPAKPVAAVVIDQENDTPDTNLMSFAFDPIVQSFVPGRDNSAGAGVYLWTVIVGDLTLSVFDAHPNSGGTELASATALGATGMDYVDVFWTPVPLTPGSTYYLVATAANLSGIPGNYILLGSTTDPYASGQVWGGNTSFPAFDLAFRTYAVPEPSTVTLLILGVAGLTALRRLC